MRFDETISLTAVAPLLGLSRQHIGRLVADGWIPKAGRGVRIIDAVHGYVRFLKDENRRASKSAAHSRLQDVRVRKEELAIAERERELMPTADAIDTIDGLVGIVVSCANAIPARFSRDAETRSALQREIDAYLTEVSDTAERLAAELSAGD